MVVERGPGFHHFAVAEKVPAFLDLARTRVGVPGNGDTQRERARASKREASGRGNDVRSTGRPNEMPRRTRSYGFKLIRRCPRKLSSAGDRE